MSDDGTGAAEAAAADWDEASAAMRAAVKECRSRGLSKRETRRLLEVVMGGVRAGRPDVTVVAQERGPSDGPQGAFMRASAPHVVFLDGERLPGARAERYESVAGERRRVVLSVPVGLLTLVRMKRDEPLPRTADELRRVLADDDEEAEEAAGG